MVYLAHSHGGGEERRCATLHRKGYIQSRSNRRIGLVEMNHETYHRGWKVGEMKLIGE
jgi:hypothetical protein